MFGRNRLAIVVAEFLGTGLLSLAMLSVLHSAIGLPYFIAIAGGLTLALLTVVFARTGDGVHFNPAITIGMWTARQIKTLPAIVYIIAQMLGAWAAYYAYTYFVRTNLQPVTTHYDAHILVAEALGAFVLALGYAAAVFNGFWNAKTAATIGAAYVLAIFIASAVYAAMSSSLNTGLANPAVALSMRAFDVFGPNGWSTYVLGPVLGSVIGFNLYALLFAPENALERVRAVVSQRFVRARTAAPAAAASEKAEATTVTRSSSSRPSRSSRSSTSSTSRSRKRSTSRTSRSRSRSRK